MPYSTEQAYEQTTEMTLIQSHQFTPYRHKPRIKVGAGMEMSMQNNNQLKKIKQPALFEIFQWLHSMQSAELDFGT